VHEHTSGAIIYHLWPHILQGVHQGINPGPEEVPHLSEASYYEKFPPGLPSFNRVNGLLHFAFLFVQIILSELTFVCFFKEE
jgi:hypothetical protein